MHSGHSEARNVEKSCSGSDETAERGEHALAARCLDSGDQFAADVAFFAKRVGKQGDFLTCHALQVFQTPTANSRTD